MLKQRLKRIEAGRLVREALWSTPFPNDTPKARAEKRKFSSAARQRINDRYSWQKLKMLLAANFSGSDLVVTLTYDDDHLPIDREEARKSLKKFLAQLRAYRKDRGEALLYIYCIENKHGDTRLHHHLVLNGTGEDYDLIRSLWTFGSNVEFERVDIFGYEELAKYLTKEPREYGHNNVGARTWVPSLNLQKPTVYPTQWVDGSVRLDPPPNAYILQREVYDNEWGRFAYIEYLLPEYPKAIRSRPKRRNTSPNFSDLEQCISSGMRAEKESRKH